MKYTKAIMNEKTLIKKCVYKKVCIQKSSMKNGVYKKILQKERKKVVKKRTSKKLLIRALGSR